MSVILLKILIDLETNPTSWCSYISSDGSYELYDHEKLGIQMKKKITVIANFNELNNVEKR